MAKLIICQGLPASGKTTWAKAWANEDPEHRVRFNRDDVRNMLGKYWVPKRENFINTIYDSFMDEAMLAGYDIVIDNMNLNKKTLKEIEDLVKEFNEWIALSPLAESHRYEIEHKSFLDTPLETCIERDSKRESPIGEKVIRDLYAKYKDEYNL